MATRTVWTEVIERRREWHAQSGGDSMESWPAAEPAWTDRLDDLVTVIGEARAGLVEVDIRAAVLDLLACGSAFVDAMDGTVRT